MPTEPPKRGRGRPPADPAAGARRKVSTWLTAPEIASLEAKYGSVYAGLQELARRDANPPTGKRTRAT